MPAEPYRVGDHVQVFLSAQTFRAEGWFDGVITRIDPYSAHRSFYWVQLDDTARALLGIGSISVFNPKHIRHAVT